MRYSWFVHLEMPWGRDRFADPDHLRRYGFIVDPAGESNPDQLPLGFTKHYDAELADDLLDISCATCHSGQINRTLEGGKRIGIRIDGGQAMHAFAALEPPHFMPVLLASMTSTYFNPWKFDRFAKKVLGESAPEAKDVLAEQIWDVLTAFLREGWNEQTKHLYPVEEGFGRIDAVGRIANRTFGDHIEAANYRVGNAPVSYPPVWEIWKFDWVQYAASVSQPMARNLGESLGVGARYKLVDDYGRPLPAEERFGTSTLPPQLDLIEKTLWDLEPPKWPEELLGAIDWDKANRGKELFEQHCRGCHGPHQASAPLRAWQAPEKAPEYLARYPKKYQAKYPDGFPQWWVSVLPVYDIGTDPQAALNFVNHRFDLTRTGLTNEAAAGLLRPDLELHQERKVEYLKKEIDHLGRSTEKKDRRALVQAKTCLEQEEAKPDQWVDSYLNQIDVSALSTGQGLLVAGRLMRKKYYEEHKIPEEQQNQWNGFGILDLPEVRLAYKSRPLAGIWATPPFLHNGSVPNLYQLLSPADERDTKFFVGRREFDPVSVGYVLEELSDAGFWFDTTIEGNLNTGHEFRAGYVQWQPGAPPQYGVIGPELSPDERWALVEYLKVHEDEPRVEFKPCDEY